MYKTKLLVGYAIIAIGQSWFLAGLLNSIGFQPWALPIHIVCILITLILFVYQLFEGDN